MLIAMCIENTNLMEIDQLFERGFAAKTGVSEALDNSIDTDRTTYCNTRNLQKSSDN